MKFRNVFAALLVLVGLLPSAPSALGFALLGPFAPWMEETNDLRQLGDIGGPMEIGSGYRWNVPIVTYGFDQSFLDYFGTNGVAAVEGAILVLNDLPPASQIVPTSYPFNTQHFNYLAQDQSLCDLKSITLSLLLEQMGLAAPSRYVFAIKQMSPIFFEYPYQSTWPDGTIPNFIVQRSFDPLTLNPSFYVNGILYTGEVYSDEYSGLNYMFVYFADPLALAGGSVADVNTFYTPGSYYTTLTYDDVGGLRYLLSADKVNYEKLSPDVRTSGSHRNGTGDGAWRPGVEKITFVRQPTDRRSGKFRPFHYRFTDAYLKNGVLMQQRAEREIRRPDFLFCVADTGENNPITPWFIRTGTTNWLNDAALNGNTNGEGPGVIQSPIKITFHKLGPIVITGDTGYPGSQPHINTQSWGSFDSSTNPPVVYPVLAGGDTSFTIRLLFWIPSYTNSIVANNGYTTLLTNCIWHLSVPIGGQALLQISTNQIDWASVATTTNAGAVTEWYYFGTVNPPKYFRVIPQSVPEPNH